MSNEPQTDSSDDDDFDPDFVFASLPPKKRYIMVLRPPMDDYAWDAAAGWWVPSA